VRYGWNINPEEDRLYGRHIRRWKGNTEMEYTGIGWEVVDCIHRASGQGEVAGLSEKRNELPGYHKQPAIS